MLAGGGIRGGQIWKTDERTEVIENKVEILISVPLLPTLGLPLDEIVYSPARRPFTLSDKGNPLVNYFKTYWLDCSLSFCRLKSLNLR